MAGPNCIHAYVKLQKIHFKLHAVSEFTKKHLASEAEQTMKVYHSNVRKYATTSSQYCVIQYKYQQFTLDGIIETFITKCLLVLLHQQEFSLSL